MINQEVTISMPLFLETGVRTKIKRFINMNVMNNLHFQVRGTVKKSYEKLAWTKIHRIKFHKMITLEFVLWKADERKGDRANVLSMHEKYFCDALTKSGCIIDDNDKYIERTIYRTGGLDRANPRVDIIIREIESPSGQENLFI